jgi:acetyl-CoA carboxylase carboxyl transferase subunit alpha
MTAPDLLKLGLIDGIVPEPSGGAHADPDGAAEALRETLRTALASLRGMSPQQLIEDRYSKFRAMGSAFVAESL